MNRIATETQLGQTITYGYDAAGNRVSMDVPGIGEFTYAYDTLDRLITLTNPAGEVTRYEYFANDLRKKAVFHNGSYTDYAYDAANRLTSIVHRDSTGSILASYAYTYDKMHNRLAVTDHNAVTVSHAYDKLYQLTQVNFPSETISFTYDPVGNRQSMTTPLGTSTYTYDLANRLTGFTPPSGHPVTFTYDANGNTLSKTTVAGTTSFTYDAKDQLRQIGYPDAGVNQYLYDPVGRRIRSMDSLGVRRFLYDGQNPLADIAGDEPLPVYAMTYTPSLNIDDLISLHQDGNTSYFLRDGQHSVRGLLRPDQTLQTTYEYNPYGAIRSQTGSTDNAFAFTGRRVEPDSGLMYYRTRYYDPEVGRFLKKDSYKGTLDAPLSQHRYAYVLNNPVNWVDPKGLTAFPSDPTIYYSLLVDPKGISDGDKLSFASKGNI